MWKGILVWSHITYTFSSRPYKKSKTLVCFSLHTFDVRSNMTTLISQQNELNSFKVKSLQGWGIPLIIFRPIRRISAAPSTVVWYEVLQFNSSRGGVGGGGTIKLKLLFSLPHILPHLHTSNLRRIRTTHENPAITAATLFVQLKNPKEVCWLQTVHWQESTEAGILNTEV